MEKLDAKFNMEETSKSKGGKIEAEIFKLKPEFT